VVLWASLHSTAAEFPKQQLRPLSTPPLLGRQITTEGHIATLQSAFKIWRNTPQGHETAGVRRRQRRLTSADNYGRKLKPTPRKQEKYDKKRRKHLKTPEKKASKNSK